MFSSFVIILDVDVAALEREIRTRFECDCSKSKAIEGFLIDELTSETQTNECRNK
jgi:hypothetical protein